MGKMHELLAVEGDLEGIYKKITEETRVTFDKKPGHFLGLHKRCEMLDATSVAPPDERQDITTTVKAKLDYTTEAVIPYLDVVLQKELTNQSAVADLVVDGQVLATSLPATFLLGLETKLKNIRSYYEAIPTLQPGISWELDTTASMEGVYRSKFPEEKLKTAKTFMHKVLVGPTDKHPAQVEKWEEQVPVGKYITQHYSAMLTPADKSKLLGKIDKLLQATKKARQTANAIEASTRTVGKEIMDFINK